MSSHLSYPSITARLESQSELLCCGVLDRAVFICFRIFPFPLDLAFVLYPFPESGHAAAESACEEELLMAMEMAEDPMDTVKEDETSVTGKCEGPVERINGLAMPPLLILSYALPITAWNTKGRLF